MRSRDELLVQQVIYRKSDNFRSSICFDLAKKNASIKVRRTRALRHVVSQLSFNFSVSTLLEKPFCTEKQPIQDPITSSFLSLLFNKRLQILAIHKDVLVLRSSDWHSVHRNGARKMTLSRSEEVVRGEVSPQPEIDQSPSGRTHPGGEQLWEPLGCCWTDLPAQPSCEQRWREISNLSEMEPRCPVTC